LDPAKGSGLESFIKRGGCNRTLRKQWRPLPHLATSSQNSKDARLLTPQIQYAFAGIDIAPASPEARKMDSTQHIATQLSPCNRALPDLEVPMINTMVTCLVSEHRKLGEHILQLALAATRLARDPGELGMTARALESWDAIRRELWSHLQVEDELVFSWGDAHQALSPALVANLRVERQEMRRLLATLPNLPSDEGRGLKSKADADTFARTLTALAQNLDTHIERYDAEVLPAILRAVFDK
jgi:iron-sulfur cluster repair protein YtfE (RIC family)